MRTTYDKIFLSICIKLLISFWAIFFLFVGFCFSQTNTAVTVDQGTFRLNKASSNFFEYNQPLTLTNRNPTTGIPHTTMIAGGVEYQQFSLTANDFGVIRVWSKLFSNVFTGFLVLSNNATVQVGQFNSAISNEASFTILTLTNVTACSNCTVKGVAGLIPNP